MKTSLKYIILICAIFTITSCSKESGLRENILIPFQASFNFTYDGTDRGLVNFKTDSLGISILNNKLLAFGTPGYHSGSNYMYSHLTLSENDVLPPYLLHKDIPNQLYVKSLGLKLIEKSGQIDFKWTKERYDEIFYQGNTITYGNSEYELALYFIQLGVQGSSYREVSVPSQSAKLHVVSVEPYNSNVDFSSTDVMTEDDFNGYAVTFAAENIEMESWSIVNGPSSEIANLLATFFFPFESHDINPDLLLPVCDNTGNMPVEKLFPSAQSLEILNFNDGLEWVYVDSENNEMVFDDKDSYFVDQTQTQTEVLCIDGVHPYNYTAEIAIQKLIQSAAPNFNFNFRVSPKVYKNYAYSFDRFNIELMDGLGSSLANLSFITDYKAYEEDLSDDPNTYQGSFVHSPFVLNGKTYEKAYEGRDNTGAPALYFSEADGVIAFKDADQVWWYFDRKQ